MNRLQRIPNSLANITTSRCLLTTFRQRKIRTYMISAATNHRICPRVPALVEVQNHCTNRTFCSTVSDMSEGEYEALADETLDSLSEMFEDLQETYDLAPEYDVTFSSGVLSVCVSNSWGTLVINKQTPNKQIWLSSPISGPKRFDYTDGIWIYKHDGCVLHELLSRELSEALGENIDFTSCTYGKR